MKLTVSVRPGQLKTFRRAGIEFTTVPTSYDVTAEQAKAIKADPMLVVKKVSK